MLTIEEYLKQLPSLEGKKVAFLVTKHLPFHWTGPNRALSQMQEICEGKGGKVLGSGIVIWSGSRKVKTMKSALENLSQLFQWDLEVNYEQYKKDRPGFSILNSCSGADLGRSYKIY